MNEYTPTTQEVRRRYAIDWIEAEPFEDDPELLSEFDRWLASIKDAAYWEGYGDGQDSERGFG